MTLGEFMAAEACSRRRREQQAPLTRSSKAKARTRRAGVAAPPPSMHHERFRVAVLKPHRRGELPRSKANVSPTLQLRLLEDASVISVLDYDCADLRRPWNATSKLRTLANSLECPGGV